MTCNSSQTEKLDQLHAENDRLRQRIAELEHQLEHHTREHTRFKALVDYVPDGIGMVTLDGTLIYANTALATLYGYDTTTVGIPIRDIIVPQEHAYIRKITRHLQEHGTWQGMMTHRKADGTTFPAYISAMHIPTTPASSQAIAVIVHDMTEHMRHKQTLQASEERLRNIVQHMPVILTAFSASGDILACNEEFERVTGYHANEIIGNPRAWRLLLPDASHRTDVSQKWDKKGDDFRDWEVEITARDGSIKTIAWSNVSRYLPIPGWASWAVGVDVTERKRLEVAMQQTNAKLEQRVIERTAELRMFQTLVENAPDGIFIARLEDTRVTYMNPTGRLMTGYGAKAIGRCIADFFTSESARSMEDHISLAIEQGFWHGTLTYRRPDDTTFAGQLSAFPILDSVGRPKALAGIVRDITKHLRAEAMLEEAHADVQHANDQLIRSARMRDTFLTTMSHELYAPVHAILGLSEALIEGVYGELSDKQHTSMTRIEERCQHLLAVIKDTLS